MNILVAKNGSQLGPFSESDIHAKLASGELSSTDLGWKEGMAAWSPLSEMLAGAPPPFVPPTPAVPPQQTYSPQPQNNPAPYTPQPQAYPPQGQPQTYAPQPYQAPPGQYPQPQGQYPQPQGQYGAPGTYNSPYPSPYPQGMMPPAGPVYAGFWLRFLAYIIDAIILAIPAWPIQRAILSMSSDPYIFPIYLNGVNYGYTWASPITFLIGLAYYGLMESSSKQATVGKMALGLKVTDLNGNRISLGRAAGRYAGQILSGWTLAIGYIMAGFTQRKQALHDIMASTLVVRK